MEERAGGHHREAVHYHLCKVMIISPRDWKKANIIQTFGRGDKEDAGKDHPVSLTPIPGKVMSLSFWRPSLSTFLSLFGGTPLPLPNTTERSHVKLNFQCFVEFLI